MIDGLQPLRVSIITRQLQKETQDNTRDSQPEGVQTAGEDIIETGTRTGHIKRCVIEFPDGVAKTCPSQTLPLHGYVTTIHTQPVLPLATVYCTIQIQ